MTARRNFLRLLAAGVAGAALSARTTATPTRPRLEKTELKVGYIALTDCTPAIMAGVQGFDQKHGLKIVPVRQPSWAAVRDGLLAGELDAAHMLYGLVYSMHLGLAGPPAMPSRPMSLLMGLNQNGQAITLSNALRDQGVTGGEALAALIARKERPYTFAQTFPTGTHAMWLYYWLATYGIHPFADVRTITVPPARMVSSMTIGQMDGYCVGEPWNNRAIIDGIGFTAVTTQDLWRNHPEKVLGARADWVRAHPNTTQALIAAILDTCRWLDASVIHRKQAADAISARQYLNCEPDTILARMLGRYTNGLPGAAGRSWEDPFAMRFHRSGDTNFPCLSDGMWFTSQFRRWGLLRTPIDHLRVAREINCIELYRRAADSIGVPTPARDTRPVELFDRTYWDGISDPERYAAGFRIRGI